MVKKRIPIKRQRVHHREEMYPLIATAAVGALVGIISAIYLRGQKQRTYGFTVSNTYNRLSDKIENIGEHLRQPTRKRISTKKLLLLGVIAGGAVGLTVYSLLSTGGKKGHRIIDRVKDVGHAAVEGFQSINWSDMFEEVADSVVDKLKENEEEYEDDEEEELEEGPSNKIPNIVDWAILGLNLWKNLKKGR